MSKTIKNTATVQHILMPVIYIFLCLVFAFLLNSGSLNEDEKNRSDFEEHYRIHSLPLPASVSFAGESISLEDPDNLERYDKELLTNIYWQSQTLLFIKRAHKYFPVIEKILREQNIPDDFKYLAVAESGLQYAVVSPSNATGVWQFLDGTGKRYGLTINEEVDERYHLEKATLAACAYFREAYNEFNSWALVAASYNMGIVGVRKQLEMQQTSSFHNLYLNSETSRYLFRIIALKNILNKPEQFGFHVPVAQHYKMPESIVVHVNSSLPDLAVFANQNNSGYRWLKLLNPWLRKNTLTIKDGRDYYIRLPKQSSLLSGFRDKIVGDTIELAATNYNPTVK
ncbi:MAG: transglycosylase SLT domain-containing protein [Bacteroidia bacterium]|jgi:hypothetical protein